jgi:hypothetical protein
MSSRTGRVRLRGHRPAPRREVVGNREASRGRNVMWSRSQCQLGDAFGRMLNDTELAHGGASTEQMSPEV